MGVRLRACPLPARCRCPKALVRGLGDSLARPVRRPESWRRCVRDRRRVRCPPRRAAWRRRFAASRRCPEGRRRSVAYRLLRVGGFCRGRPSPEEELLPRFPLPALDVVPAAVPRPEGRFWLRSRCPWSLPGCLEVSHRGGAPSGRWLASVAAARKPSGFPPRRGAVVTAGVAAVAAAWLLSGVPPRWSAVWLLAGRLERAA